MRLLQSFSNAVTELAEAVAPSVVGVSAGRKSGTGIVWSEGGLIVTANHVVGRSEAVKVSFGDGRELEARVLGRDSYTDVALLKVESEGLAAARPGSAGVRVGQFVLALAGAPGARPAATSGIVTSHRKSVRGFWGIMIEDAVVSDAKLNPGYSGGPLVDASGNLVGMNVAYFAGRGVAVSVDAMEEIVRKISEGGGVKKGFLGVEVEPIEIPDELAKLPEVGQDGGLLVRAVEPGSPARAGGIAMGDVILALGNTKATSSYELHRALSDETVGKSITLRVLRSEKPVDLKVTPREAKE